MSSPSITPLVALTNVLVGNAGWFALVLECHPGCIHKLPTYVPSVLNKHPHDRRIFSAFCEGVWTVGCRSVSSSLRLVAAARLLHCIELTLSVSRAAGLYL